MSKKPKASVAADKSAHARHWPKRKDWEPRFFVALAETSDIAVAAGRVGITVGHIYKLRRTEPEFAHKWLTALCEAYDNLELELLHRVRSGEEPTAVGPKFDNAVALRMLIDHRERVTQQRAIRANEDAELVIGRIDTRLDGMRERAIASGEYRDDGE